jgi:flagellar hook-associated protein 3 FlgL
MQNLLGILRSSIGTSTYTTTQFSNELSAELTNIDQAMDNVLRIQSDVGTKEQEIESLGTSSSDLAIQYKSTLSDLQDLDYNKTISDFLQQQMNLQAAQSSFAKISGLSLFNYL